jgi:HEAT repeat protein
MKPSKHIFLSYRSIEVEFALQLASDLKNAGINMWMDRLDIKPGDDWVKALTLAVNECAALVSVLTPEYANSKYCQRELSRADRIGKPIFPIILRGLADDEWPLQIESQQYIDFSDWRTTETYQKRITELAAALKDHFGSEVTYAPAPETRYLTKVIAEMETYKGLLDYVATQPERNLNSDTRPRPSFLKAWTRFGAFKLIERDVGEHVKSLSGINEAIEQYPRFVLLGTPGAGKSTILQHLTLDAARAHQNNPRQTPLPLLLKLIHWLDEPTPVEFIRAHWTLDSDPLKLLAKGEISLYLDGLSEITPAKAKLLRAWMQSDHAPKRVIVTCRDIDYTPDYDLGIPLITTAPMDGESVDLFITEYLGKEEADKLINRMTPRLYELVANPFLLNALILAHTLPPENDLPQTTGTLLKLLTLQLWELEQMRQPSENHTFVELETALTDLAFAMTDNLTPTYVTLDYALQYIGSDELLQIATNANFLEIDGDHVRFFYQPMQEYFAACGLARKGLLPLLSQPQFRANGLRIAQKWDNTIIMLAGISDDADILLDEVNDVDPYLALECINAGIQVSDAVYAETIRRIIEGVPEGHVEAGRLLAKIQHPTALSVVLDAMREGPWEARKQANTILQGMTIFALPGVTDLLHDLETNIREAASIGLRQLGDSALPTLLQLLHHEKWFVRRGAAWGLKEIRDRAAVPALTETLYDKDILVTIEAATALGWVRDEAAVPDLLKTLHHKNARIRKAATAALSWIGHPAQAGLLLALQDSNAEVRLAAVEALKGMHDNAVLKAILKASYDEHVEVRGAAIEALKDWGEDAIVLKRLTEALWDTTRTRLSKMRIADIAANVFESLGNKEAHATLERWRKGDLHPHTSNRKTASVAHERIKKNARGNNAFSQHVEALRDSEWTVRRKAIQQLVVIDPAAALPEILPLLKDEDNQVRVAVVKGLTTIASDAALRGLVTALNDTDPLVADAAADSLKNIGKRALPDLIDALRTDNANVRGAVIEILSKIDDATAVPELILCLSDTRKPWLSDWRVSEMAARALEAIGTPEAVKAVRQWRETERTTAEVPTVGDDTQSRRKHEQQAILQNLLDGLRNPDWSARQDTAKSLREYAKVLHGTKEPHIVARLVESLEDPDWVVRWSVTEALAWIGDTEAVPPLLKHLDDKNWTVRVAVIRALLEIGDKQAGNYVMPYLDDGNSNVREAAAEALGVLGGTTAVQGLLKAMTDRERFVRLAAIDALGKIKDRRAVPSIMTALRDTDLDIRWFAATALGKIGDASAVPALIEHLQDKEMPKWEETQRVCDVAIAALELIGTPEAQSAVQQWRREFSQ